MNVGYPDTKNKQGGHSPLMTKKKKGGFLKKVAGKVGTAVGKASKKVGEVVDAYKSAKETAKS